MLELQVADVVKETDDARSLVFTVPDGAISQPTGSDTRPAVPDPAGAQRPHRLGRPLLLAVQLAVHRRPDDRDRQAHGRRLRVELVVRQRPRRHAIHVFALSGTFVPKTLDTDFLLLAAGSGITPMMAICKSALAEGSGRVVLIYANRDENSVIFAMRCANWRPSTPTG